jgi:hypothetical protein
MRLALVVVLGLVIYLAAMTAATLLIVNGGP